MEDQGSREYSIRGNAKEALLLLEEVLYVESLLLVKVSFVLQLVRV